GVGTSTVDAACDRARAGPAAAARVGPVEHPAGAGGASDGGVVVVVQRVDQHAVVGDVVVDVLLRPPGDRVDLDHLPLGVPLHDLDVGAGGRLVPADA